MSETIRDGYGRPQPPVTAGEWDTLLGFLEHHRATLRWRTDELDADALDRRLPGHPSDLTLGGMLKHLAYVEEYWLGLNLVGRALPEPFASVDWEADPDWDWHSAAGDTPEELRNLWAGSVARSRAVLDAHHAEHGEAALDQTFTRWGRDEELSVRWLLVHLIEEYARHNGHADLLREPIDGQTGE